jgi:hypothetical protein
VTNGPEISDAVVEHLGGRPLVLRATPRHGCCGGRALVPVAEPGPPSDPAAYLRTEVGPVTCFVDPRLDDERHAWRVELVGFGRWRRLQLEGAHGIDPEGPAEDREADDVSEEHHDA